MLSTLSRRSSSGVSAINRFAHSHNHAAYSLVTNTRYAASCMLSSSSSSSCSSPFTALTSRLHTVSPLSEKMKAADTAASAASCSTLELKTSRPSDTDSGVDASVTPVSSPSSGSKSGGATYAAASTVQRDSHFDLVVIGSGPAGQKCAIDAAKKGKRVCVVDKAGMFGGVCIHTGTIPSKTFREAILHVTAHRERGFGGEIMTRSPNLSKDVLDRVKKVEQWETETILRQLHRNKVSTVQGTARFLDPHHIEVTSDSCDPSPQEGHIKLGAPSESLCRTHVLHADKFLIACGSRPARNPNYPWDSPLVFDSDAILKNNTWGEIKNLIVVGAGVIAMEYASMFNTLPNCKVTIIEERPTFLDFIDHEVVDTLKYVMRREGAQFLLGEKVRQVSILNNGTQVRVDLDSGKDIVGDALFYAVGRQSSADSLTLENASVQTAKRGLISVNEYFQTSQNHIYAAGDVIGFPALASTAMEQGRLCSQHMFGSARPMKPVFPYGIYTIPEISVVGHSEQELTKMKVPYKTGVAKYEETAKGQMMGGPHIDGFLKLLFCPTTHRLLGCSAIGENATEIIHIGQSVMSMNGSIEYFRDSVFNYPTYAELFRIAALDGLNKIAAMQNSSSAPEAPSAGTPTI